ncbi:hypothetical protein GBAR_LOCUS31809 [Geodia barretti]|uniref:Uncharacterized protein n=1 Tax=Geodia barretti TaxID=519541 RepID=A0AA35U1L0_GEOBA|nr:hypothetical protein GBAR_LOCUS31809 [Geodia barretti]
MEHVLEQVLTPSTPTHLWSRPQTPPTHHVEKALCAKKAARRSPEKIVLRKIIVLQVPSFLEKLLLYWWRETIIAAVPNVLVVFYHLMILFVKNQCSASVTQSRMEWTELPDFAIVTHQPMTMF